MVIFFAAVIGLLVVVGIATAIFVHTSPQFGQAPQGDDLTRLSTSPNFAESVFKNTIPTEVGSFWKAMRKLPEMLKTEGTIPVDSLPASFSTEESQPDSLTYVTWFGHSAFLIETHGKRILIDPMFGDVPSPLPFGTKRFAYKKPIPLVEIENIDLVIISHDHYDHLDYPSILELKDDVAAFITPLGVGSHLKAWGVDAGKIKELDWWDETEAEGIKIAACPARHFSGRGITDRNATQWASWVITSPDKNIYFSGDGGYGPHFKEIGSKYGPFDFAMLECGQYNEAWSQIHMMPEETVQAGLDVNAALSMPIHWGAFKLAPHKWQDPIERFTAKAHTEQLAYVVPQIGKRMQLGVDYPKEPWWTQVH